MKHWRLTCQLACLERVAALPPHPKPPLHMGTCRCRTVFSCGAVAVQTRW